MKMKITIGIQCECGETETAEAIRTVQEFEGKVYEDYSDIAEGFKDSKSFHVKRHPNAIDATCLKCDLTHEIV